MVPFVSVAIAILVGLAGLEPGASSGPDQAPPARDFRRQATAYAGPGRDRDEPADVAEVRIGYFGPSDASHADGGDLWQAAELAVREANAAGGYRGKPFRLVPAWSDSPWQAGTAQLARLVYQEQVWAIVGGIDGPSAHLAEQVVAKARVPLVCSAASDHTANLANVPWIVSVLPGDHLQAPVLAGALADRVDTRGFALISAMDHDSRMWVTELERALRIRTLGPRLALVVADEPGACDLAARRVLEQEVSAVVLVAGAAPSAALTRALRAAGFPGTILGSASLGRRRFAEEAGTAAEGVLFPLPVDPAVVPDAFRAAFERHAGHPPDFAAAASYDAVGLVVLAVRQAGLNRARIGDAIRAASPWSGATGEIRWDAVGGNTRVVTLGTIHHSLPRPAEASRPMPESPPGDRDDRPDPARE